jgi:hypothetical protein
MLTVFKKIQDAVSLQQLEASGTEIVATQRLANPRRKGVSRMEEPELLEQIGLLECQGVGS